MCYLAIYYYCLTFSIKISHMIRLPSPLLHPLLFNPVVNAQDKIAIDDRSGMLSPELEAIISQKLLEEGITYTKLVDFTKRCEYFFSVLQKSGEDLDHQIE